MPSKELKFLLVDDDPSVRETTREYLYSFGYTCTREADGIKAALEVINTEPVDVIISDWDMPGASGYTLLKLVKLQERFRHVAFVILSGAHEHASENVTKAARLGVDGYLLKPFRAAKLKIMLNQILAKKGLG